MLYMLRLITINDVFFLPRSFVLDESNWGSPLYPLGIIIVLAVVLLVYW